MAVLVTTHWPHGLIFLVVLGQIFWNFSYTIELTTWMSGTAHFNGMKLFGTNFSTREWGHPVTGHKMCKRFWDLVMGRSQKYF